MKIFFVLITSVLLGISVSANNIQVSNISVSQPNISFTISWDNSWNTMSNINPLYPNNWDGAWVFIKYQNNIDNLWKHATVSSVSGDHSITGGVLQIDAVSDGMGVFIRRTNPGNGSVSATVTLKMNALVGTGSFNFKVFGTEVVYIPQSNFQLGDGNVSGTSYLTAQDITAVKQSSGVAAGTVYSGSPAIPAAWPMGYNAYYMMKYEITNEQWVDFLNTLNYDQQASRIEIAPNSAVNTLAYTASSSTIADNIVKISAPGLNNTVPATFGCDLDGDNVYNETNDGQNMAIAVINKADIFAFLDWSGLRPMTEMEFEKACRGTQNRVANEFAWGSTEVSPHTRTQMTNPGLSNETWAGTVANGQVIASGGPNGNYGPARAGVFATNSTGRATAGAGFYGNMDLSGSTWEFCVMIDAAGVNFTGANGNGSLTTTGDADVTGWPSGSAATGTILKGGSWYETSAYTVYISVSYRIGAAGTVRSINSGGRGVRTAP